ncbi:MAG: hypothetical protein RJA19_579 [Bacteroidota bacterium]|jgi:hypothetical protein
MIWFWLSRMGRETSRPFLRPDRRRMKPPGVRLRIDGHDPRRMTLAQLSPFPTPNELEQYKVLIRHVHGEPVMLRRALRLAFRNLSPQESILLRDWLQAHYAL